MGPCTHCTGVWQEESEMRASIIVTLAALAALTACTTKETKVYTQPAPQPAPTVVVPAPSY